MLVTAAYAAGAAALGLLVHNQTTVITGALVWMLAIENVVPLLLHAPWLRRWLLDGSADRLLHLVHPDPAMHSAWLALLTFVAVSAGLAVTATVRFERTDIA